MFLSASTSGWRNISAAEIIGAFHNNYSPPQLAYGFSETFSSTTKPSCGDWPSLWSYFASRYDRDKQKECSNRFAVCLLVLSGRSLAFPRHFRRAFSSVYAASGASFSAII